MNRESLGFLRDHLGSYSQKELLSEGLEERKTKGCGSEDGGGGRGMQLPFV